MHFFLCNYSSLQLQLHSNLIRLLCYNSVSCNSLAFFLFSAFRVACSGYTGVCFFGVSFSKEGCLFHLTVGLMKALRLNQTVFSGHKTKTLNSPFKTLQRQSWQ